MRNRHPSRVCRCAVAVGLGVLLTSSLVRAADPTPPASAPEGAGQSADVHQVSQRDKSFAPGEITVETGDEVVFLNDDEISHNVFSRSAEFKFNLKIQRPGEHKSYRFESAGRSVVRCAIHPNMKLVVNVVEPGSAPNASPVPAEQAADAGRGRAPAAPAEVAP